MWETELRDICRKLKPILGARADALWLAYLTAETPDSKREAEVLIHLFSTRYLSPHVDDSAIRLPPPSAQAASGEVYLGSVLYSDRQPFPLYLNRENFIKHIGIFSITGGGKTNVAQILLLGLLGKGIPFIVIDWKRSYRALRTLKYTEVSKLRVYSVGRTGQMEFNWNPLRPPPGIHPQTWIAVVAEALEKSHVAGPGVADIFMEEFDKLFRTFGFYTGTATQYPNFFDARSALDKMQFKGRRMLWKDSCMRILRTFTFGPAAGAFNALHPLKFEELLDKPVILELDQELPKPLRVFFSDIVLRWIHLYRLGQGETDQLRHVTFLEEVHNLFPRTQLEKQATNSLENVFREIRGFGEGLVNITQHPSLLPIYILGNCNTLISLGLQHEDDIMTARRALFLTPREDVFLDRLAVGEAIVKVKGRIPPCHVRFPKVPVIRGTITDEAFHSRGDKDARTGVG